LQKQELKNNKIFELKITYLKGSIAHECTRKKGTAHKEPPQNKGEKENEET